MLNQKLPLIYLSGIITSIVTMFLIFMMGQQFEFNLLGFYVWIFPVGALIAGLASGSGYMASARLLNVNTGKMFAISIGAIAFAFYTLTHYLIYISAGSDPEFSAFIANTLDTARNSSLTIGKSHKSTVDNIGYAGYAFLALEYIGFITGTVIVLNGAKGSTYCEKCKKYFKNNKDKFYFTPHIDKTDLESLSSSEKSSLITANTAQLRNELEIIRESVKGKTLEQTLEYLMSLAQKSTYRQMFYITFAVQSCPVCRDYDILPQLFLDIDNSKGMNSTNEAPILIRK
ncbi:MAG TPA: hypothetical protein PLH15_01445 [Spirochaetota bacterium]|jgi:thioredoxin-related protein|nr:hypothetical protein [Spirochaetota bacterium]HQO22900.1 hypothetical protein [Spirochaetota bacterium]HQQ22489.1 hypothetical protein [Spirochaetota bacterium]